MLTEHQSNWYYSVLKTVILHTQDAQCKSENVLRFSSQGENPVDTAALAVKMKQNSIACFRTLQNWWSRRARTQKHGRIKFN